MENEEPKDESMPAPVSVSVMEETPNGDKLSQTTEIDAAMSQLETTCKDCTEEFCSLGDKFKSENKDFISNLDLLKESLLKRYSKFCDTNEKLSLKNKKLESDSQFKSIMDKPTQLINKITALYTILFDMVRNNMKIISHFLNIGKNLEGQKPLLDFLTQEFNDIVDHWMFMKIDFDNFNVNEALSKSDLDDNFKAFITKIFKKKSMKMCFEHMKGEIENEETKKKIQSEKKIISENAANITKLIVKNMGDFSKVIERNLKFPKLKKFSYENGKVRESDFAIQTNMPNLEKLSFKYSPNFEVYIMERLPDKLKRIYLEKCNFINADFGALMKLFNFNTNILNNLEVLSLAGNNITKVDFTNLKPKTIYQSLLELNFKKNKLYKFIYNPENFPKLKFVNCSKNNFNKSYLKDGGKVWGLESGNGFLFEPDLCKTYYDSLKKKICVKDDLPYVFNYLNISFMPKMLSTDYFQEFELNTQLMQKIKKLDLSYNGINCNTFFMFLEKNTLFIHLNSLNLNGNEIDDTFFEKLMKNNVFPKLEHLYLNSNYIGDPKIKVEYKDDIPIDKEYQSEKEKILVFKLRLIYKFIQQTPHLNKITITKNPISEFYSVTKGANSDKSDKYIKRDFTGKIAINCLFSMLVKIRDELLANEIDREKRKGFNLKFDCRSNVNKNSENYPFGDRPIERKKEK